MMGTGKPIIIFGIDEGIEVFVEMTKKIEAREPFLPYMVYSEVNPNLEHISDLEELETLKLIPVLFMQFPFEDIDLEAELEEHQQALIELIHEENATIVGIG